MYPKKSFSGTFASSWHYRLFKFLRNLGLVVDSLGGHIRRCLGPNPWTSVVRCHGTWMKLRAPWPQICDSSREILGTSRTSRSMNLIENLLRGWNNAYIIFFWGVMNIHRSRIFRAEPGSVGVPLLSWPSLEPEPLSKPREMMLGKQVHVQWEPRFHGTHYVIPPPSILRCLSIPLTKNKLNWHRSGWFI
jgi:hypothetical protein